MVCTNTKQGVPSSYETTHFTPCKDATDATDATDAMSSHATKTQYPMRYPMNIANITMLAAARIMVPNSITYSCFKYAKNI